MIRIKINLINGSEIHMSFSGTIEEARANYESNSFALIDAYGHELDKIKIVSVQTVQDNK